MTNNSNLEKRYSSALRKIGGAEKLLSLPPKVQEALKSTVDFETRVQMLELVAEAI